jgi:hypothetical protein
MTFGPNITEKIQTVLEQRIDWEHFIETADQHRVLPLVYRSLNRFCSSSISGAILRRMAHAVQANSRRNFLVTGELLQILAQFQTHGIRAVPYKGPVLSAAVYGDISLRQFDDLDIIVPVSCAEQATVLLLSRGYKLGRELSRKELLDVIQTEKDLSLVREKDGMNVELHWGITCERDPIQVDPAFLWQRLTTLSICGRTVLIHSPEDLLVILCIHGAKHRWERLGWLCDIAEIVRSHETLDWNRAIEQAVALRSRRIVFLGVRLATDIIGAQVPPKIRRAIEADPLVNRLADDVKGWIASDAPIPLGETERYFMNLRERRADRFLIAVKQAKACFALTSRDTETFRIPKGFSWTLYFVRPFRLAWEYGLNPLKRFVKGVLESW